MSINNCPCRDCTDRNSDCHSECRKYIDWSNERKALKELSKDPYKDYRQAKDLRIIRHQIIRHQMNQRG